MAIISDFPRPAVGWRHVGWLSNASFALEVGATIFSFTFLFAFVLGLI